MFFGLSIGFWIAFLMKEVFDYEGYLTRHFQKIISGYNITEMNKMKVVLSVMAAISIIIYLLSNLFAKLLGSDKDQLNDYFN